MTEKDKSADPSLVVTGFSTFILGIGFGYVVKGLIEESQKYGVNHSLSIQDNGTKTGLGDEDIGVLSATIICIIFILIFLTIGFEIGKEYIDETVDRHFMPMIDSMFREVTILGFLSIITFVVTQFSVVTQLSILIFGEPYDLLEIFEFVHYTLFFIVILFISQVLVSAQEAMGTETMWLDMDRAARSGKYMRLIIDRQRKGDCNYRDGKKEICEDALLGKSKFTLYNRKTTCALEDQLLFYCLREEFIKDRCAKTFHPTPKEKRVPEEFNFGRYCSVCMGKILSRIVDVKILTWYFFGVSSLYFYILELLTDYNMNLLACLWVGCGYGYLIFERIFEHHLNTVLRAFASSAHLLLFLDGDEHEGDDLIIADNEPNEQTYLTSVNDPEAEVAMGLPQWWDGDEHEGDDFFIADNEPNEQTYLTSVNDPEAKVAMGLPQWCHVDVDAHVMERSWFMKSILGERTLNRQHAVYWFEHHGPESYQTILQINLVFIGIYCSLLFVGFLPRIYEASTLFVSLGYMITSLFPVIVMLRNKQRIIASTSLVCSIGAHRSYKEINRVQLEDKIAQLVRTLVVLFNLNQASKHKRKRRRSLLHYSKSFDNLELWDVEKTFNLFDASGNGKLDLLEVRQFLQSSGMKMSNDEFENIVAVLDVDGDGEISKQEFLQWYTDNMVHNDLSSDERAKFLFDIFDTDKSGYITVNEFKHQIDAMNIGFSVQDVGELVGEMDEDGDGQIGLEEFETLLERYYPKELGKMHHLALRHTAV